MGIAVAQQMVKTMNEAIDNMRIPGAMNPLTPPPQFYYAIIEGNTAGPFSMQELARLIIAKKVSAKTHLWKPGMPQWETAEKLPEILRLVALTPPPFTNQ